jgi:hypothetical protein
MVVMIDEPLPVPLHGGAAVDLLRIQLMDFFVKEMKVAFFNDISIAFANDFCFQGKLLCSLRQHWFIDPCKRFVFELLLYF